MLLETKALSYAYDDGTPALNEITLHIEAGDQVAVLGANGSGKSTLLRLLNGLIFPSAGAVSFRGRELTEKSLRDPDFQTEFRQCIGFVFQNAEAQLFNPSVLEEVAFGPQQLGLSESEIKTRVDDVLQFLGIRHLADRPPFRLSGGEKRKVAIASVLSMNPEVLIFDEPFVGLDPRSQTWLVQTIGQLQAAGKTTIIATHALEVVPRVANKMFVLSEEHRLVATGSVEEGLANLALLQAVNLI